MVVYNAYEFIWRLDILKALGLIGQFDVFISAHGSGVVKIIQAIKQSGLAMEVFRNQGWPEYALLFHPVSSDDVIEISVDSAFFKLLMGKIGHFVKQFAIG